MKHLLALLLSFLILSLLVTTPSAVAEITEFDIQYDANGNRIQDDQFYYEYNDFNQLARVRQGDQTGPIIEEYLYDENGERLMKWEPQKNQTTYYWTKEFITVINSSGKFEYTYYYDGDTLLGRMDPDGSLFFYHPDHLGSTTLVTNQAGEVVMEITYGPFGVPVEPSEERFQYTGKELDPGTELYYYGARYYDPKYAQFAQPDPIVQDPYNPQNLNRYSYTLNNPYRYTDPTGNVAETVADLFFAATSLTEFVKEPTLTTGVALAVDIGALIVPVVPAVGGIAIRGAAKAPDVAKAADLTGEAENVGDLFGFWDKITTTGKAVDQGSGTISVVKKGGKEAAEKTKNLFDPSNIRSELNKIGKIDNKRNHILAPKHNWNLILKDPKWSSVSTLIERVLKEGVYEPYKELGHSKILKVSNNHVRVTYNIDEIGKLRIGNAWVE